VLSSVCLKNKSTAVLSYKLWTAVKTNHGGKKTLLSQTRLQENTVRKKGVELYLKNSNSDNNQNFLNLGMEALKIEILNPKALQLIKGMQELKLIKVSDEPVSKLKGYLQKMRRNSSAAPNLEDITTIVEDVRTKRYAKK
jgi:hypothetical protein